jgi:predicted MarR family transcription regulator
MKEDKKTPDIGGDDLHRHWELGHTAHEIALTEFEWTIMRFYSAFERCILQLANISGEQNLNPQEVILLHVVSMQKSPQTSTSLARQLNRDDLANIQYTLRKLASGNLIEKQKDERGRIYTYKLTKAGLKHVKQYAAVRSLLLPDKAKAIDAVDEKLDESRRFIGLLTGIYDEVARESPTYTRPK